MTIDPQSSAILAQKLAQNKRAGNNRQMPWNETEGDDDMNDREGQNRQPSQNTAIENQRLNGVGPSQASHQSPNGKTQLNVNIPIQH